MTNAPRLPLRYWGASAVLSVAADDDERIAKALTRRTSDLHEWMDRVGVSVEEVAAAVGVSPVVLGAVLDEPLAPPAIMLDAEDAIRRDARDAASRAAADRLADVRWPVGTLRFVRVTETSDRAVRAWLERTRPHRPDALVLPKAEDPSAIDAIAAALQGPSTPRLILLIETPRGVAMALELAERARHHLGGLLFGSVDYAALAGLPPGSDAGSLVTWARLSVVNAAAAVGVPAFDGMTVRYPVAPRRASPAAARAAVLASLTLVAQAAAGAAADGMCGKLVGHPAQTVAVMAVFRAAIDVPDLDTLDREVVAFAAAAAAGAGVGIHEGRMFDAATDAVNRARLRRAAALGVIPPVRALELDVITPDEAADLTQQRSHP